MPEVIPAGDAAVILKFGRDIDAGIHAELMHWLDSMEMDAPAGILDLIPSYAELMVVYDPAVVTLDTLSSYLDDLACKLSESWNNMKHVPAYTEHEIPVLYDHNAGPDLALVASHCKITEEELISLHTSVAYRIYMLGFLPGFCYLGGMDKRLTMPRKDTPRIQVPAGSVGIAGMQTGIYPLASPGGWQIIGQTPLKMFDWQRMPVFLVNPGDSIRFCKISKEEFSHITQAIQSGTYVHRMKRIII